MKYLLYHFRTIKWLPMLILDWNAASHLHLYISQCCLF